MARAPRYDANTKAAVTAHAGQHGFAATYERWPNINRATIRQWCSRSHVVTCATEKSAAIQEGRRRAWEERRTELAHRIGEAAELALDKTNAELDHGSLRNAKDAALTMAILVDKAQLLAGGATTRTEHVGTADLHAKIDELAERRKRAA